jgi:signal transduction histidine kinase
MLGSYFLVSSLIAGVFLLLGALVFSRNPKATVNKTFFAISISVGIWLMFNSVAGRSDFTVGQVLVLNHLTFLFGLLATFWLAFFSKTFIDMKNKKLWYALVTLNTISGVLSLTPLTISGAKLVGATNELEFQPLAVLYFLTVVINSLLSVGLLFYYRRRYKGVKLSQINLILSSFFGATFIIIVTNIILPSVFGVYSLTSIGSFAVIFIILGIAVSIITHKLFDIRILVAKSVAYTLLLFTLTLIFMGITLPITRLVIPEEFSQTQRVYFYAFVAVILAAIMQPIKKYFDKLTNKLFYRDAYDSQVVLDQVSGVIVGNVDPHKVQKGALIAISEALRPTYVTFLLGKSNNKLQEGDLVGQGWRMHDPEVLQESLKSIGRGVVVRDELEEKESKLREILMIEDISVAAPLVTKSEHIGYLIIGPKKSGNIYNSQDIGLLSIATNELAVALQNAQRFEEIQAFNITLQEKVTEATREVKKTNRKLIALDEAKDEFISMASHQLRTPLTSIKGYISMMLEGDLGKVSPQQEQALKEAFGSSQRMVYLIADFLNVSRIKTGKFVIETKEVDLPQVVGEEITQLREMAASRDITLQYEAPGVFPRVKLDDNKIRQVMMNIVDNAIYYTPSGGTVTIQLYVDAKDVVFKVVDTGIGVPKREQHKLFTKFFRAGNARKARPDGTGLGLFMAQKIIVEQGGTIIFESTEGKGSTFGFRFPLSKIKT